MAHFWKTSYRYHIILVILTGVFRIGRAQTTQIILNEMDTGETTTEPDDTTTYFIDTTTIRVDTTSIQSTTFDFQPIINERNSLKKDADSLRAAVIVLGILAALFLIAIIAGIVWIIRKRKQSKEMDYRQDTELSRTSLNNAQSDMNVTKVPGSQNATKAYTKKGPISPRTTETSTKGVGGIQSDKTHKLHKNDNEPDDSSVNNSTYRTMGHKSPSETPKTEQEFYENSPNTDFVRSDSTQSEDSEVYVQIDSENTKSKTAKGISDSASQETSRPQDSSSKENESEEIYENCGNVPAASSNYSALDTDNQYAHTYSQL